MGEKLTFVNSIKRITDIEFPLHPTDKNISYFEMYPHNEFQNSLFSTKVPGHKYSLLYQK